MADGSLESGDSMDELGEDNPIIVLAVAWGTFLTALGDTTKWVVESQSEEAALLREGAESFDGLMTNTAVTALVEFFTHDASRTDDTCLRICKILEYVGAIAGDVVGDGFIAELVERGKDMDAMSAEADRLAAANPGLDEASKQRAAKARRAVERNR